MDSLQSGPRGSEPKLAASHKDMANAIRALSMDAVQRANSGHPGMPMGMADVATVLYTQFLKFDPARPDWPDRDRFVLSAGHGSMLLYSLLHLTGYPEMTLEQLKNFRQLGSLTAGHPEVGHAPGIETTTGPLGQGLANAVGMALAERLLNARFGDAAVDHHTYVIAGDGCLMEGISHEAISLAGHLGLSKLILLFDDNSITIDGPTSLSVSDDQAKRFEACGWDCRSVDGHDPAAVAAAIEAAKASDKPSMIACKTSIGYGSPNKAGKNSAHGAPLGEDEIAATREALGWPHAAFEIPDDVMASWRATGAAGAEASSAWDERIAGLDSADRSEFERRVAGELPADWRNSFATYKQKLADEQPKLATRVSSQKALDVLAEVIPELIGGSADLTGSNNTKAAGQKPVTRDDYSGGYLYYGIREHGMAAAMNGMALHGGVLPYGGTFLVFTDYCRPSIRLSALMKQGVVYVMTHDSIGLGEDGPTHQPIEHLAALRAIPNLNVFRPADAIETAECWELAIQNRESPSVIALTRQGLPTVRKDVSENLSGYGAYILSEAKDERQVTLVASGSEIEIALKAQEMLTAEGISSAVVSIPCWELFADQSQHYRDEVLGPGSLRVGIEAALPFGWERWIGPFDAFVGMQGFGASAPAKDLFAHFKITPEAVVENVKARL
ncbi:transketolase [Pelagibius sp. Alg239-R121]|uniref:transketolase n=1 Tax=Pelagibius sp. Alg239-R121 TaxID=2993448 RepID=UPI002AC31889|nr:transketolase [Pelagibius sp. Alg239-R121]